MPVRRTIEELAARYFLEPDLEDVIVEGEFDRDVLNMVFTDRSDTRAVYEIDTIDVQADLLRSYGLSSGNKQRVIALAQELARSCPDHCRYLCLVDKDVDHWLEGLISVRNLKWSKYSSLDAHFYSKPIAERLLVACGKAKLDDFSRLFDSMGDVLCQLYIIRVAGVALSLEFDWPDFTKSMSIEGGAIHFDVKGFKVKLLNKSGLAKQANALDSKIAILSKIITGDIRNRIRGHDLIDVMAWVLMKTKGVKPFASPAAISRLLVLEAPRVQEIYEEVAPG